MYRCPSFLKSREFRGYAGIFSFTVLWFGIFAVARIDMHHDAIMLKPAIDVAAGKVIFRDTFCHYGALSVWLQALAVKFFGGEIVVGRLLTVVFYGGIAILIDLVFRRFLSLPFRIVNLILFWGMAPFYLVPMHPWSSVYSLFFMLLTEEHLLRFFDSERRTELFRAGFFAACAFLARHPCGAAIFAAGAAVLAVHFVKYRREWDIPAWYVGGAAAVLGVFAIYISATGAWSDYLRQCFGYVVGFAVERGGNLAWGEIAKRFFPLNEVLWLVDTIYSLLPLACLGSVWAVWHRLPPSGAEGRPTARRMLQYLTVALTGVVSWHQYYPVPCVRHLYWAAIPMFGVFALVAERLWRSEKYRILSRSAAVILLLSGAIPVFFRFNYGTFDMLRYFPLRRRVNLKGCRQLWLTGKEGSFLLSLDRVFAGLPPEIRSRGVFNYTPDAVLSVIFPETGFRHKMFVNWGGGVYPDYPQSALAYILRFRPAVVSQQSMILPDYKLVLQTELYGLQYWFYAPLY